MAIKIIPISELRQKLKDVIASLEATGDPYFITQYSRPKAVLVRYEDYNALVEQAEQGQTAIVQHSDEPIIRDTRISVRHIVERVRAGQSVEDILAVLPHLTAAQIYDALSYYHHHQPEMDQLIKERRLEYVAATQSLQAAPVTAGVATLQNKTYHDLDDLAGTWSAEEAESFETVIADFEKIDEHLWS